MRALYKAARRTVASRLNGWLLSGFGVKVVRSIPRSFSYRKLPAADGLTRVAVTTASGTVEVRLREGTSDWMTFDQVLIDEDYDLRPLARYPELKRFYDEACAVGTPLIIDLGANIGLSALYFSLVWPRAQIVAVEPDPGNFDLLRANTAGAERVEAVLAGAASRPGSLRIVDPSAPKNAFATETADGADAGTVEAVTVEQMLQRYPRERGFIPFLIKIDVEGAEAELFSGATDWIDAFPLLTIELHDWMLSGRRTSASFLRSVAERDRDFVYLDENVFSIRNPIVPPPHAGADDRVLISTQG